jgi:hypothetical protein
LQDGQPTTNHNRRLSHEPPTSNLLTPLTPMWYLPLDDDDTRPAGIPEVSTPLSLPLVSSPPRLPAPVIQATESDRMTPPCGPDHSNVEAQCGHFLPFVAPPDGLTGARFTMFQPFLSFSPPAFDVLPSDGFPCHSYPSLGGKRFIDSHLSFFPRLEARTFSPGSPLSRHRRGFHSEFPFHLPARKSLLPTLGTPWFHATTEQAHHNHLWCRLPQKSCLEIRGNVYLDLKTRQKIFKTCGLYVIIRYLVAYYLCIRPGTVRIIVINYSRAQNTRNFTDTCIL